MGSAGSKDPTKRSKKLSLPSPLRTTCLTIENLEAEGRQDKENVNNNKNPGLSSVDYKIVKLKVSIDKKQTSIDEKSAAVLKYRTPHFRALACVEVPALDEKQEIQVGWIQTCSSMHFVNKYGAEGYTSWEFPEVVSGKYLMVSDADGKQYPWYGSKHEVQTVTGPSFAHQVNVHMNDNFFPQVTWYVPHNSYDKKTRLTWIHRKQKFFTYLVAKDVTKDTYHVLKTLTWSMELNIEVSPSNPLGKRAKLVGPLEQETPTIVEDNLVPLEKCAIKPPNANNAQTLVWRPTSGVPKVIVPPVDTTMDLEKYLIATKDLVKTIKTYVPEQ